MSAPSPTPASRLGSESTPTNAHFPSVCTPITNDNKFDKATELHHWIVPLLVKEGVVKFMCEVMQVSFTDKQTQIDNIYNESQVCLIMAIKRFRKLPGCPGWISLYSDEADSDLSRVSSKNDGWRELVRRVAKTLPFPNLGSPEWCEIVLDLLQAAYGESHSFGDYRALSSSFFTFSRQRARRVTIRAK
jgi:hypothetical protein